MHSLASCSSGTSRGSSCLHGSGVTTGESLPEDSKLLQSLRSKGKANGFSDTDIDALLPSTMFAVISWDA
ncbi:MAG: hypothetical protein OXH63_05865, partial [Gemmatimonadetes bacterium]|nr:hypothetical protein [Gemmatimonadota bacterium]